MRVYHCLCVWLQLLQALIGQGLDYAASEVSNGQQSCIHLIRSVGSMQLSRPATQVVQLQAIHAACVTGKVVWLGERH